MARAKTISQNVAVLASANAATGAHNSISTLLGVNALDYSWSNPKQDVVHYGKLAPQERVSLESPDVSLTIGYHLKMGENESHIGLNIDGTPPGTSALSYLLDKTQDQKNYFIFIAPEGQDAIGLTGASSGISVIGIGNGFINSYSLEASVGDFPTVSVQIQGLNIRSYDGGANQESPAINPTTGLEITGAPYLWTIGTVAEPNNPAGYGLANYHVLRPGDVTVNLANAGGVFHDYSNTAVQSVRMSFDLNRTPVRQIGARFATSREIQFPVNVNFEAVMLAKDLVTGSLANFLCQTGLYDAQVIFKVPSCSGNGMGSLTMTLKNISLEGQSWSTAVGGEPQTVATTWVGQISSASDVTRGLFISGAAGN